MVTVPLQRRHAGHGADAGLVGRLELALFL